MGQGWQIGLSCQAAASSCSCSWLGRLRGQVRAGSLLRPQLEERPAEAGRLETWWPCKCSNQLPCRKCFQLQKLLNAGPADVHAVAEQGDLRALGYKQCSGAFSTCSCRGLLEQEKAVYDRFTAFGPHDACTKARSLSAADVAHLWLCL